jgi:hypothetical protein
LPTSDKTLLSSDPVEFNDDVLEDFDSDNSGGEPGLESCTACSYIIIVVMMFA